MQSLRILPSRARPGAAAALGLALACGAVLPLQAAESGERALSVPLTDLDLTSRHGLAVARQRLAAAAAARACGGVDTPDLWAAADYERCKTDALDGALRDLRVLEARARTTSHYADSHGR